MGLSKIRGTLFWSPYKKDPTIYGAMLGSLFSETPIELLVIAIPILKHPKIPKPALSQRPNPLGGSWG